MKDKFVHDIESARAEWANQIIGERDRLRAEVEILVWNLAGISTMACCRTPILYNGEMARPALDEVAELVKDYARLRAANAELRKILARALAEEKCGADGVFFTVATECTEGRCWHFQARAALSRAEQAKPETETCVWSEQSTSCNAEPSHSLIWFAAELTFCPFCGKRIEVKK